MSRYTLIPGDPAFVVDGTTDWMNGRDVSGDVTEAEANIIAWALNTVAEGHRLAYEATPLPNAVWRQVPFIHRYHGPTDGVAP